MMDAKKALPLLPTRRRYGSAAVVAVAVAGAGVVLVLALVLVRLPQVLTFLWPLLLVFAMALLLCLSHRLHSNRRHEQQQGHSLFSNSWPCLDADELGMAMAMDPHGDTAETGAAEADCDDVPDPLLRRSRSLLECVAEQHQDAVLHFDSIFHQDQQNEHLLLHHRQSPVSGLAPASSSFSPPSSSSSSSASDLHQKG